VPCDVSFCDTYGAARSGGRSHEGVDMFAPEGTPLVAVTYGTTFLVKDVDDDIGGISLWIRAANGTPTTRRTNSNVVRASGVQVRRGQVVAYVGRTRNAIGTAASRPLRDPPWRGISWESDSDGRGCLVLTPVSISRSRRAELTVERQASAGELRVSLTKRLAALAEERQKLLRAYYANAIPLELLKRDQDRITESEEKAKSELVATEADLEKWQEVLTLAIGLAGSCHAAYLKANPKVRRRFNQAVLKAVYVEDGKVKRAEYADVFAASSHARVRISGSRCS
jgi:hypothetical protein